jgi:hypothetical protein
LDRYSSSKAASLARNFLSLAPITSAWDLYTFTRTRCWFASLAYASGFKRVHGYLMMAVFALTHDDGELMMSGPLPSVRAQPSAARH